MTEHAILDFETRSVCDISLGGFKYSAHPTTEVLMLGWKLPKDETASVWQIGTPKDSLAPLFEWVSKGNKVAGWNIGLFDLPVWNNCFAKDPQVPTLAIAQCADFMTWAGAMSLPQSLDACGQYFELGDAAKDKAGKKLITTFCKPRRASKANPDLYWNSITRAEKWDEFVEYCRQDIVATEALGFRIKTLREECQEDWVLTQKINEKGIPVSINESAAIADAVDEYKVWVGAEITKLTKGRITSPSQTAKIKAWVNKYSDLDLPDVTAPTVTNTLAQEGLPPEVREILGLRKFGSST
ncbi:MAG: ribonuclease H-like domain-containing protein, partial [Ghiorsea sp.]